MNHTCLECGRKHNGEIPFDAMPEVLRGSSIIIGWYVECHCGALVHLPVKLFDKSRSIVKAAQTSMGVI